MSAPVEPAAVTAAAMVTDGIVLRRGPRAWLQGFAHMLRFEYANIRSWAALIFLVQVMMGVGMAVMYGFFYPDVDDTTALLITTGVPTLALVPLGFVLIPGSVGQQRMAGTFDFIWSLPVPRSAQVSASFALYSALALPGTVLALLVGCWTYGVSLSLSPVLVPAVLVSAVMSVAVGYAMALLVSNPLVINLISNAVVFLVLMFTPIVYPLANQPVVMQHIHEALPFYPMAQVIRAGLTEGVVTGLGQSFIVIGAWAVAGTALTAWAVGRRH
jgi:ABC-2 type transport system permease protein